MRIALLASSSKTFFASIAVVFQARAAVSAEKGLIGRSETSCASFSLNRSFRMENSRSEGGAPWGKRLSRSESCS